MDKVTHCVICCRPNGNIIGACKRTWCQMAREEYKRWLHAITVEEKDKARKRYEVLCMAAFDWLAPDIDSVQSVLDDIDGEA